METQFPDISKFYEELIHLDQAIKGISYNVHALCWENIVLILADNHMDIND